ncbi:hypothetical protein [Candidatus Vidania fulgoroideorum]
MNYCLIGNPVNHSYSPSLHKFLFSNLNKFIIYYKFKIIKKYFYTKLVELVINNFKGINITMPLKEIVRKFCNYKENFLSINTLFISGIGIVYGYNTDYIGFKNEIKNFKNYKNILLIGLGGSSKVIMEVFKKKNIYVYNRYFNKYFFFKKIYKKYKFLFSLRKFYSLIINTTPFWVKLNYPKSNIIFNLNYCNIQKKEISGIGMLFEQAIYSIFIWLKFNFYYLDLKKIYIKNVQT